MSICPPVVPQSRQLVSTTRARYILTTLPQAYQFLAAQANEAYHARQPHRRFTGTDSQETHGEKEVSVSHEGQKCEYNEAFQGQEDG